MTSVKRISCAAGAPAAAPRRRGGFTLMEVLIALSVFAMAAVVLGGAYLNILNGYEVMSRGMETDEDVAFARTLVLQEPDRTKLEQGGEFDTASGRHARWSVEIASTTMPDLFTVNFTVEINDPTQTDPQKTVETFTVLRPTWTIDPAERDKLRQDVRARIAELQGKTS